VPRLPGGVGVHVNPKIGSDFPDLDSTSGGAEFSRVRLRSNRPGQRIMGSGVKFDSTEIGVPVDECDRSVLAMRAAFGSVLR